MVTYHVTDGAAIKGSVKGKRNLLKLLHHPDYMGKSLQISLNTRKRQKDPSKAYKPNNWLNFLKSTKGKQEFLSTNGRKDLKKVRDAYLIAKSKKPIPKNKRPLTTSKITKKQTIKKQIPKQMIKEDNEVQEIEESEEPLQDTEEIKWDFEN